MRPPPQSPQPLQLPQPTDFPFGSPVSYGISGFQNFRWNITDPDLRRCISNRGERYFSLSTPRLVFALYESTQTRTERYDTLWGWFELVVSICQSEFENLRAPSLMHPEWEDMKQYIEYYMGTIVGEQRILCLDEHDNYVLEGTQELAVVRDFKWTSPCWGMIFLEVVRDRDENIPYPICLGAWNLLPQRLNQLGIALRPSSSLAPSTAPWLTDPISEMAILTRTHHRTSFQASDGSIPFVDIRGCIFVFFCGVIL